MESIINQLNNLTVSTIGNPEFDAATKANDAKGILNNHYTGKDLVFSLKNDIKSITIDQVEVFNRELRDVKEQILNFVQSEHGIINVGPRYKKYRKIRNKIRIKVGTVAADPELTQQQKNVIIYVLLPIYNLPDYDRNYNPDKGGGEKTFSKMLLNVAVMHSKSKFEYVDGYYSFHQETLI
ncbi:hypothetical protein DDB_G0286731 [Dictyostelium discoideum AX4]|uniref:Uncharacterized protein n=1 Tax=Dictyostelium discoideum TaxID=44689 RepID=Q54LB4_DICDI|nr:hypothetical protein DDB_G0286731 [Dictyostelium discoideum AX4]EAL64121.1 hypothetical protein DDB_G0286731 [Dictyostelium discoideum AX4]|eukprot:XP_637647.1 hypothetical protein DDB_G0286731 [Dictyostelium discoideum AX4]